MEMTPLMVAQGMTRLEEARVTTPLLKEMELILLTAGMGQIP